MPSADRAALRRVRRVRFRARVLMWGLFVGAAAAALAPAGPGALVPLKMAIASADSVGNDVYVAVVVDFGSGSAKSTISTCVPVASNAHDADALVAAVGSDNVAYNNSGLLCAIDNYPSNGVQNCGESVGSGDYDYWSYWHGASGTWIYANDGPAEQSVSSPGDDVVGLKFQTDEPDTPSDPPPSVAPVYAQICNSSTETPPPQSSSGSGSTPTTPATTPAGSSVTPTTGKPSAGPAQATTSSTAVSARPKPAASTTTTASGATTTTTTAGNGDTTSPRSGTHGSAGTHRLIVASAASHDSSGGSSSHLLPVILIAVVVAALGGLALFRWRRRPAEE
jgi:hypothetical protein